MAEAQFLVECYPYGPIRIHAGEKFTIGRRPSNALVLPLSSVSRDHAAIEWGGDAFYLFDLNSANGTQVNGKPTKMHRLEPGDRIRVGPFSLTFKRSEGNTDARESERGMMVEGTPGMDPEDAAMGFSISEEELGHTLVLKRREEGDEEEPAIRGKLSDVALVELIQFLEQSQKTGTLKIDGPVTGNLYLKEGRIVHAVCGDSKVDEAAFALLHLVEGDFEMAIADPDCEETIETSTSSLIFEALKKADESSRHSVES